MTTRSCDHGTPEPSVFADARAYGATIVLEPMATSATSVTLALAAGTTYPPLADDPRNRAERRAAARRRSR